VGVVGVERRRSDGRIRLAALRGGIVCVVWDEPFGKLLYFVGGTRGRNELGLRELGTGQSGHVCWDVRERKADFPWRSRWVSGLGLGHEYRYKQ
jgi:hypothetical protein